MKKWLGRLKERFARLKPWLKQHWKIVLVVLVAAAVFLFVVLRKPGAVKAALNPPADATGGAAGGDTAAAPVSPATVTNVASAIGGHGSSGGSLFDPPAPLVSRPALPTSVARPQVFSQVARSPQQGVGSLLSGANTYAGMVAKAGGGQSTAPTPTPLTATVPAGTRTLLAAIANVRSLAGAALGKAKPGVIQAGKQAGVRPQGPAARRPTVLPSAPPVKAAPVAATSPVRIVAGKGGPR